MLCDQWLRLGCRAFQRGNIRWAACIPERDTHISKKSAPLYSLDRGFPEECAELCVGQAEIFSQRHVRGRSARTKRGFARLPSEPIPRAGIQAVIAPKDSIAHQW